MDYDDHDDPDEEMGLPPGPKVAGSELQLQPGSGHRKGTGSGGRYRECLKNHAVGIGGHAVDGCGEFMAAGEEGTLDALRCAACNCHRNFHRKESPEGSGGGGSGPSPASAGEFHHQFSPYYRTPAGYLHHHHGLPFMRPPAPLALPSTSGGGGGGHSRGGGGGVEEEELSDPVGVGGGGVGGGSSSSGRKRFRTKFTQEQKDKMLAFAEGVGWRIQKHDEAAVQQFCNETGVKRHVLKVWMHNNKHTLGTATGTPVRCGRACRSMIAEVKESAFIVDRSDDLVGDPRVKVESVDEEEEEADGSEALMMVGKRRRRKRTQQQEGTVKMHMTSTFAPKKRAP